MSRELYCRLYLTCPDDLARVDAALAAEAAAAFDGLAHDALLRRNTGYEPGRREGDYDCIADAPYTVELDADGEPASRYDDFVSATADLVVRLRKRGWIVTVSSYFEEEIIDRTGWNWTESAPNPPGWRRNR